MEYIYLIISQVVSDETTQSIIDKLDTKSLLVLLISIAFLYFMYRIILSTINKHKCNGVSENLTPIISRFSKSLDSMELILQEIRIFQEINIKKYSNSLSSSASRMIFQRVAYLSEYKIIAYIESSDVKLNYIRSYIENLFDDDYQLMSMLTHGGHKLSEYMNREWVDTIAVKVKDNLHSGSLISSLDLIFESIVNEFNGNLISHDTNQKE